MPIPSCGVAAPGLPYENVPLSLSLSPLILSGYLGCPRLLPKSFSPNMHLLGLFQLAYHAVTYHAKTIPHHTMPYLQRAQKVLARPQPGRVAGGPVHQKGALDQLRSKRIRLAHDDEGKSEETAWL